MKNTLRCINANKQAALESRDNHASLESWYCVPANTQQNMLALQSRDNHASLESWYCVPADTPAAA